MGWVRGFKLEGQFWGEDGGTTFQKSGKLIAEFFLKIDLVVTSVFCVHLKKMTFSKFWEIV